MTYNILSRLRADIRGMKEMVKEAIDLMESGAIAFTESDDEYETMVSAVTKQVDTMIIHGMFGLVECGALS